MAPAVDFTIDVHTHPIPEFFRTALINAGYTVHNDGKLIVDGHVTPPWTMESYLQNREEFGYDYSIMSITAPGVNFLNGNPSAAKLARDLNNQMAEWTKQHPTRLGAFGVLPLMDIETSLKEIKYCLDELDFDGIGLYTNYNGIYLGDPSLDPIMELLNERKIGVLVHPVNPTPTPNLLNLSSPSIEYPFDTTRAVTNMIVTGAALKFPDVKLIFSHGGGTVPFLADRIAGTASLPWQGGRDREQSLRLMKNFYYDLASCGSDAQLAALKEFTGTGQLVIGSDTPYFPAGALALTQKVTYGYSGFSKEDIAKIRHQNVLDMFPTVAKKLAF